MWIVPKAGLNVRDPVTYQLLPVSGLEVSETDQHWNRQLISGDVVLGAPPLELPATPAATDAPAPVVKTLSTQDKE